MRLMAWNPTQGYMMDTNIKRAKDGQEAQIVIFDMANFSTMQTNFSMIRTLITINQDCYPERLSICVLLNAPRLFRWAWRTICPWIDANTRDKIRLLSPEDNASEILLEHIDPHTLEVEYGGTRQRSYPIPPTVDDYVPDDDYVPEEGHSSAIQLEGANNAYPSAHEQQDEMAEGEMTGFRDADPSVYAVLTKDVLMTLGLESADVHSFATQVGLGILFRVKLRVDGSSGLWQCDVMQPPSAAHNDSPFLVSDSLVKDVSQ